MKYNELFGSLYRFKYFDQISRRTRHVRPIFQARKCVSSASNVTGPITNGTGDGNNAFEAIDLSRFPTDKIRNFSIIAHVDHGKSTLADRLLEITGTIQAGESNKQVLDKLQVERERGITVKAQTASLLYRHAGSTYLLNLIDTPGHVDFSYEVSRSISACQGVILLIDANQGVQAQTVANFYLAFGADLVIIPVLNKIDLKNADPEAVTRQVCNAFDFSPDDVLRISAKLGHGIKELLSAVVELIPPPPGTTEKPFRSLVFDSWFDRYRGVMAQVAVIDGQVRVGDEIMSVQSGKSYEVRDVGIMRADETVTGCLFAGQVGYIAANVRNVKEVQVGDTLCHRDQIVPPLPGFRVVKPMVYAGLFPIDQSQIPVLRQAMEKLTLNDSSVSVHPDSSPALGQGWRLGFLGLLHMDVFGQRLEQEYDAQVVITAPNVPYKAKIYGAKNIKKYGGDEIVINNPLHFPDLSVASEYFEPMVLGTIITPQRYLGKIMGLCMEKRGVQLDSKNLDETTVILQFRLPLNEIIVDFFDELKTLTSGYASFDYEDAGYQSAHLVKLSVKLNGTDVEEMTTIVHSLRARTIAKIMCARLKETVPQQQFVVAIQVMAGGTVLARENLKALRKDVTAKLYGGDVTRRQKLLKHQKEGKSKLRMIGNIGLPRDTFIKVLRK